MHIAGKLLAVCIFSFGGKEGCLSWKPRNQVFVMSNEGNGLPAMTIERGQKRQLKAFALSPEQRAELYQGFSDGYWSVPQQMRAVALLRYADGQSLDEIACWAGKAVSTVQIWLRNYRKAGVSGLMGKVSTVPAE